MIPKLLIVLGFSECMYPDLFSASFSESLVNVIRIVLKFGIGRWEGCFSVFRAASEIEGNQYYSGLNKIIPKEGISYNLAMVPDWALWPLNWDGLGHVGIVGFSTSTAYYYYTGGPFYIGVPVLGDELYGSTLFGG